jgi:transketolase
MCSSKVESLQKIANEIRLRVLDVVYHAPGGHIGGSNSVTDILVALYYEVLKHDPKRPDWEQRDYLILSKGHCCLALYSILEKIGYTDDSYLNSYCHNGGKLGGHPKKGDAPGIEATTGSLGHGLPIGNGLAMAHKLQQKNNHFYVVLGDGEMNEGSVWEGLMFASQQQLDNLTIVIDNNKLESLNQTNNILSIEPLTERLTSFGWNVNRIDGHDFMQLLTAFDIKNKKENVPTAIIADTIKGKGISFMEGVAMWHHRKLKADEYEIALKELKETADA